MKQKLISKLKRVALALFAALCVGSTWAEEGADQAKTVNIDGGYKIFGLGENRNETAVVFTRTGSSTWTVPIDIKNARFLVVGGGGGGGADSNTDATSGGSGGGGGGVVTGEIDLTKNAAVTVTVGAGGAGGKVQENQRDGASSGNYYGGSCKGGNSILVVGDTTYVTAYGGGRDQGVTKSGTSSVTVADMREGGQGGSNAGSRGGITTDQTTTPKMGDFADIAALNNCKTYGNKGGKGCSDPFYGYPAAGGGGGATEAGGDAGNDAAGWLGGKGGEGLASWITGNRVVYGSGGGGASTQGSLGGMGGEGAGNGGDRSERTGYGQGTSAVANQGGGGGGTSREISRGGDGGSGIVVIRYVSTCVDNLIFANDLESAVNASINGNSFVYNGQVQTPLSEELLNSEKYVISGDPTAREAGTYTFTVTPNEGYAWDDETRTSKEFTWSIQKINPAHGYIKEIGDEVVVVFTNHTADSSWTVPYNIYNAQFLVVGGGGGGGADCWDGVAQGGGGGGGGGVITGLVNFVKQTAVTVTVGRGGTGGSVETKPGTSSYNYFGAAKDDASPSSFSVGSVNYVTANAGGRDLGSSWNGNSGGQTGGAGGSSAGSRPGVSTKGEANPGTVNTDVITVYAMMGNQGGAGNTGIDFYGYKSAAGGGGGATQPGGTPSDYTTGGNGGEGYASDITGTLLVYGSGGGGGTISRNLGGKGGTGAGDGNVDNFSATSALPNQGGGGGGGGRGDKGYAVQTGGNGGSGIVVFRYKVYAAEVNSRPYDTLDDAITAATDGDTITVLRDVATDAAIVIEKNITLDLNGKTIEGNAYPVIRIQNGANVIVKNGTITNNDYVFVLGSSDKTSAGYLEIQSGNYTGVTTVASVTKGTLKITGGTFAVDMIDYGATYLLNCYDANYKNGTAKIEVTGGTFVGFNPANNTAEGANTNFCADGYTAVKGEEEGTWVVQKAISELKPGVPVTNISATTEEEAIGKVKLTVAPPDGLTKDEAAAYEASFTMDVKDNGDGTWTVAAVLAESAKPLIGESATDAGDAFTVDADNVVITIQNYVKGLNYGVISAAEITKLNTEDAVVEKATVTDGKITLGKSGDTKFYKVIVDFNEINESPKAE